MKYAKHDGVVIRRGRDYKIEMLDSGGKWVDYPASKDGDIAKSGTAAWMEGTPLTKAEADEAAKETN